MSKLIFTLICLFTFVSLAQAAETVYKKTKPDGAVEFTDKPSTGSEKIKIRKPSTYSPAPLPSLNLPTNKQSLGNDYSITIAQPVNDSTIVNQTEVQVSISVQPALLSGQGHQIRYSLAGESIVSRNSSETFKDVSRGTHNLTVSIIDANAEVVSPVASTTFHVKRFHTNTPAKRPKAP